MHPPLKTRLKWSADIGNSGVPAVSTIVMARTFAYLFAIGATLALLMLVIPSSAHVYPPGVIMAATLAYGCAAVFVVGYDRLPVWFFHVALDVTILLIGAGAVSAGSELVIPFATMYFWSAMTAFSFFERRYAIAHVTFIGLVFAIVLALREQPDAAAMQWTMLMGAIFVAGLVVGLLRARLEALVSMLGDAALTDSLTGLANRRAFQDRFDAAFAAAQRQQQPLGIVCLDLDFFKSVNDHFGHEAGDRVLRKVADVLQRSVRRSDTAVRLGGEEFVILVPDTDEHGAYVLAERIRMAVRQSFEDGKYRVTASCGVAGFPRHAAAQRELLQLADRALYAAKELGRNRSVMYSDEIANVIEPATLRQSCQLIGKQTLKAAQAGG